MNHRSHTLHNFFPLLAMGVFKKTLKASPTQSLEIVNQLLKSANESNDEVVKAVYCDYAKEQLSKIKVPGSKAGSNDEDKLKMLKDAITKAKSDYAHIMEAGLKDPGTAEDSKKMMEKLRCELMSFAVDCSL